MAGRTDPRRRETPATAAPCSPRSPGIALPDPGGGFRDRTPDPNSAPRPAFRARRLHFRVSGTMAGRAASAALHTVPAGTRGEGRLRQEESCHVRKTEPSGPFPGEASEDFTRADALASACIRPVGFPVISAPPAGRSGCPDWRQPLLHGRPIEKPGRTGDPGHKPEFPARRTRRTQTGAPLQAIALGGAGGSAPGSVGGGGRGRLRRQRQGEPQGFRMP